MRPHLYAIATGLILCGVYSYYYAFRAYVEIEMDSYTHLKTVFRIYWRDKDEHYSRDENIQILIRPNLSKFNAYVANLKHIDYLRIDPIEYKGEVKLKSLKITQPGFKPLIIEGERLKDFLVPKRAIEDLTLTGDGIKFKTSDHDGQFEMEVALERKFGFAVIYFMVLLLLMAASFWLHRWLRPILQNLNWVPVCLCLVFVSVAVMATTTRVDTHPDEKVHVRAVEYYSNNFLPPAIDDPDIAHTYSIYGYTRLANFEVFYQLAGYFSALLKDLHLPDYLKARSFNVLLLVTLLLLALQFHALRFILVPMLLTAQAWYLFAYANSDALGLFIGMLVAYQAAYRGSTLNRVLQIESLRNAYVPLILVALLAGMLLVVKSNYYYFALFLVLYLFWRIFQGDFPNRSRLWMRVILVGIIAAIPYGTRLAMDISANGFDKAETYQEMHEKYAQPQFKPSTPLAKKHIYLNMKDQGVSVDRMFERELWDEKSFVSAFGHFGYTQFAPPLAYYDAVKVVGVLILFIVFFSALIWGTPATQLLMAMAAVCIVLLGATLFYYSWAISFQPQGRYFAAALPILSVLYYELRHTLNHYIFYVSVAAMFLLNFYAFVLTGLHDVQKIQFGSGPFDI